MAAFEANGKSYDIKYTIKRIELYEGSHRPLMESFQRGGGTFSVAELRDLTAYGLMREGGGYVSPSQGVEMAERLIEENGYFAVYKAVAEAMSRDCGFLFKMSQE